MSIHSSSAPLGSERQAADRALRHVQGLVGKTLAYFAERETANLELVRGRLLQLLDAGQPLERAQNLRSAYVLLGKSAVAFNRVFRTALKASLDGEVNAGFTGAAHSAMRKLPSATGFDGLEMSLIEVGEVDRILMLDRVVQRFTARYDASISPLTQRLGVLQGQDNVSLSSNPFRSEVFVRAFIDAWDQCALDEKASEDLLLTLEPPHFVDLSPLYTDLNATLLQAGVHAQTVYRIKKTEGGYTSPAPLGGASAPAPLDGASAHAPLSGQGGAGMGQRAQMDGPPTGEGRSAWGGLAPAGRSVAVHARQFLQKLGFGTRQVQGAPRSPGAQGGQGSQEGGQDLDDEAGVMWSEADGLQDSQNFAAADPEFMGYLGDLQAGAEEASSYQTWEQQGPAGHNLLRRMRDREEVRRAPELDRGTLDALAEVFDYVFADQAIPLQMKYVIGRLQIPVLKAAMIDRDFFLSDTHPARRLVDTLASASVSWSPEKGEGDPLYQRIEGTVQRVLSEFEDDLELFSELLREFTEFLFETEQQAQERIEPTAEVEREGESFEQALAHVDEVVHARIAALPPESPLVPFLAPFLTTQWREVMARSWLHAQDDPTQWESAVTSMDQLIWSIQPKTKSEERKKLVAVLPDLVRNLNTGLDDIEWVGDARAKFTRRLISTHMLAIRMTQPAALDALPDAEEEQAGQAAMTELDQRRATKLVGHLDDYDDMAHGLARGQWFDFVGPNAAQHRCRLSWVSPMRTRLLFTNREGFDAFVRSEREVAQLLRQGSLVVVNQEPIVARALERLMSESDQKDAA